MAKTNGRLPPLNALRAFEAAARHLSFKNAARELHVTAGAVSHQIKLLEDHLGVALFRRLTRALELTNEARAMLPKVREGLASLAAAVERVRAREESTTLTVMGPPNFTARWLLPRLARFTGAHPHIELHVASRLGMIDGREGNAPLPAMDPRTDTPLIMVRFGEGRYPGGRVDELFSATYVPVCSPRLLKGKHPLRTPRDLRFHMLLHDDTVAEEGVRPSWGDWLAAAGVNGVDASRGAHFSNASLALEAAIEGMGVTLALKPLVSAEVEAKRLAIPFEASAPTPYSYYLVTPAAESPNPSVESFRAWLVAEAHPARR